MEQNYRTYPINIHPMSSLILLLTLMGLFQMVQFFPFLLVSFQISSSHFFLSNSSCFFWSAFSFHFLSLNSPILAFAVSSSLFFSASICLWISMTLSSDSVYVHICA